MPNGFKLHTVMHKTPNQQRVKTNPVVFGLVHTSDGIGIGVGIGRAGSVTI